VPARRSLVRLFTHPLGVVALSAPGYVALAVIAARHSLPALLAGQVPPDLGYPHGPDHLVQSLHIVCFAYLFFVYALALWQWRRHQVSARAVAGAALIATILAGAMLPVDSSDVLEYIGFGRIVAVYHTDPYVHTYSEFSDDFSNSVTWDDPMPYGPVVLPVFALAGLVSTRNVLAAVAALKLVWGLVHLLNTWLVYQLARRLRTFPEAAAALFALNPLILVELLGNAHNDGLLIMCGLAALWALLAERDALAVALAFGAALVKASGLFWLAGIVGVLVAQRRWSGLARGVAVVAAASIGMAIVWPDSWPVLAQMDAQWRYTEDSLHTMLIVAAERLGRRLGTGWEYDDLFWLDRLVASALFGVLFLRRWWAIRDVRTLVTRIGGALTLLLLLFAVSVYPWYWTWLLPLAALTTDPPLRRAILLSSAAAVALYAFPADLVETGTYRAFWFTGRLLIAFAVPAAFWACDGRVDPVGIAARWRMRMTPGRRGWRTVADAPPADV